MDNSLPYAFDLLFDIKTKEQLAYEVEQAKKRLEELTSTMEDYGIVLETA